MILLITLPVLYLYPAELLKTQLIFCYSWIRQMLIAQLFIFLRLLFWVPGIGTSCCLSLYKSVLHLPPFYWEDTTRFYFVFLKYISWLRCIWTASWATYLWLTIYLWLLLISTKAVYFQVKNLLASIFQGEKSPTSLSQVIFTLGFIIPTPYPIYHLH